MKTLYRARRVRTLSHPAEGEWLLMDGRHVERVGSGDPPAADRTVDLPGTTIIPGFIDAHVHLTGTGIHAAGPPIDRARSAEHLVQLLKDALADSGGGLLAHGFDETRWDHPGLPSLADLDDLSTRPLVVVRTDGHLSLANTPAIEASGVLHMRGVDRDSAGRPTGVLRREANTKVQEWFHRTLPRDRIQFRS